MKACKQFKRPVNKLAQKKPPAFFGQAAVMSSYAVMCFLSAEPATGALLLKTSVKFSKKRKKKMKREREICEICFYKSLCLYYNKWYLEVV